MARLEDLRVDIEDQNAGREFHLVDPVTGAVTDWWVRVAGPYSDVRREAEFWYARERMKIVGAVTPEKAHELAIGQLARLVVDMGGIEEHGEPLLCTVENVVRLFTLLPWARSQVDLYASSTAVYAKPPAPPPRAIGPDGWPIEEGADA